MKQSAFGAVLAAALFGLLMASPAAAKTAKECRAEWSAHKAENKAKGVTEKAYVAKCRGETEKPKAAKKTKEKAAEKKAKESKEDQEGKGSREEGKQEEGGQGKQDRKEEGRRFWQEDGQGMRGRMARQQGRQPGQGHHRKGLRCAMPRRHRHGAGSRTHA